MKNFGFGKAAYKYVVVDDGDDRQHKNILFLYVTFFKKINFKFASIAVDKEASLLNIMKIKAELVMAQAKFDWLTNHRSMPGFLNYPLPNQILKNLGKKELVLKGENTGILLFIHDAIWTERRISGGISPLPPNPNVDSAIVSLRAKKASFNWTWYHFKNGILAVLEDDISFMFQLPCIFSVTCELFHLHSPLLS